MNERPPSFLHLLSTTKNWNRFGTHQNWRRTAVLLISAVYDKHIFSYKTQLCYRPFSFDLPFLSLSLSLFYIKSVRYGELSRLNKVFVVKARRILSICCHLAYFGWSEIEAQCSPWNHFGVVSGRTPTSGNNKYGDIWGERCQFINRTTAMFVDV